ncbi:MAG: hypothetical protein AABP62_30230 [Planctomycetota bacterium]
MLDGGKHANKELLIRSYGDSFTVGLDDSLDVDWSLGKNFKWKSKAAEQLWGEVHQQVIALHAVPLELFSEDEQREFRRMLGEAVALAFEESANSANSLLKFAVEFVTQRTRGFILKGATVCSFLVILVSILSWSALELRKISPFTLVTAVPSVGQDDAKLEAPKLRTGDTFSMIVISMGAGALGALLSVFWGRVPLKPTLTKWLIYCEGASRIGIGVINAVIAGMAVELGLLLPIANNLEKELEGVIFISIIAGLSERLVSSFVDKFENQSPTTPQPVVGEPPPKDDKVRSRSGKPVPPPKRTPPKRSSRQ